MVKEKKESIGKGLKMKVAFVCDKESLIRLEEVRMSFLQREDKRIGNSALMRKAIESLWKEITGKK